MAWYCNDEIRFRGRLIQISFRRHGYHGARVVKGKPLAITGKVIGRLLSRLKHESHCGIEEVLRAEYER